MARRQGAIFGLLQRLLPFKNAHKTFVGTGGRDACLMPRSIFEAI